MNRAERRRNQREMEKAIEADDFMRVIEIAQRDQDASRPLTYAKGYIHTVCGGEAQRPNNWSAGAYCLVCGVVPIQETRRQD